MMIGVAQVIGMNPTLRILLLDRAALREHLGRTLEREELRERSQRGRGADRFEEGAAGGVPGEDGAHHRRRDYALVAIVRARDRYALELPLRLVIVLGLASMPSAGASRAGKRALGIEGIVEG